MQLLKWWKFGSPPRRWWLILWWLILFSCTPSILRQRMIFVFSRKPYTYIPLKFMALEFHFVPQCLCQLSTSSFYPIITEDFGIWYVTIFSTLVPILIFGHFNIFVCNQNAYNNLRVCRRKRTLLTLEIRENFKEDISWHSALPKVNKTVMVKNWGLEKFPRWKKQPNLWHNVKRMAKWHSSLCHWIIDDIKKSSVTSG